MTHFNEILQIPNLNETNYNEFLLKNQKTIFVYETEDYDYHYYFPSYVMITGNCRAEAKFALQWG